MSDAPDTNLLSELDTSKLLRRCNKGERSALDEMFARVYRELRSLAHRARGGRSDTMGTTGLIHEAYLKLRGASRLAANDRRHFCRTAAKAMRQILMNAAEARLAKKRGSGQSPGSLIEEIVGNYEDQQQIIDVGQALDSLRESDSRMADIVELRYFGGYTSVECAEILGLSVPTIQRDWRLARAWLSRALNVERCE